METRATYGYYGTLGGTTGENAPKTHKSGWQYEEYTLITDEPEWKCPRVKIKASDMAHAIKQAKKHCRDNHCNMVSIERA